MRLLHVIKYIQDSIFTHISHDSCARVSPLQLFPHPHSGGPDGLLVRMDAPRPLVKLVRIVVIQKISAVNIHAIRSL